MTTDMGIELGKLVYWNMSNSDPAIPLVKADRTKLKIHTSLVCLFFVGGIVGAVGFKLVGFSVTIMIAIVLLVTTVLPFVDDVKAALSRAAFR